MRRLGGLRLAPRRVALYAALALILPLPAFALPGEGGGGPATLAVSATLAGCGLAGGQIACTIDVAYDTVEGATSYTASVSAPNGSVTDFGTVPAGGVSLTVPYVGNGVYTVRITAYGPGGEDGEPEELSSGVASPDAKRADEAKAGVDADRGTGERAAAGEGGATPGGDDNGPAGDPGPAPAGDPATPPANGDEASGEAGPAPEPQPAPEEQPAPSEPPAPQPAPQPGSTAPPADAGKCQPTPAGATEPAGSGSPDSAAGASAPPPCG